MQSSRIETFGWISDSKEEIETMLLSTLCQKIEYSRDLNGRWKGTISIYKELKGGNCGSNIL